MWQGDACVGPVSGEGGSAHRGDLSVPWARSLRRAPRSPSRAGPVPVAPRRSPAVGLVRRGDDANTEVGESTDTGQPAGSRAGPAAGRPCPRGLRLPPGRYEYGTAPREHEGLCVPSRREGRRRTRCGAHTGAGLRPGLCGRGRSWSTGTAGSGSRWRRSARGRRGCRGVCRRYQRSGRRRGPLPRRRSGRWP